MNGDGTDLQLFDSFVSLKSHILDGKLEKIKAYMKERNLTANSFQRQATSEQSYFPCPVCFAANHGFVEIMDYLISEGFSCLLSSPDDHRLKLLPIHLGSYGGHLEIIESLVEKHGVNVNSRDAYDNTPLYWAIKSKFKLNVVKYLIDQGADLNVKNRIDSSSLLHISVRRFGGNSVCEYLLSRGADVSVRDCQGNTPLHDAAFWSREQSARALLEAGADVNALSDMQQTPFSIATKHSHLHMIKLFIEFGADPEIADHKGLTPLHLAAKFRCSDVMRYLCLHLNVDPCPVSRDGKSPLDFIMPHGDLHMLKMVSMLLEIGCKSPTYKFKDTEGMFMLPPGYDVEQHIIDVMKDLETKFFTNPRSLQDLCKLKVRRTLGRKLSETIDLLPVPSLIKNEIRFSHLAEDKD